MSGFRFRGFLIDFFLSLFKSGCFIRWFWRRMHVGPYNKLWETWGFGPVASNALWCFWFIVGLSIEPKT
jgi:hypothetical protein